VEAESNTFIVALRVVGGDEKGTQFLVVSPGHPFPGGYKYGDLALQVEVVSIPITSLGIEPATFRLVHGVSNNYATACEAQ
jgi:hypothetical protein